MKKVKLLIVLLIGLFITTKVEAITYTDEDIEDYSIVIGTHLFTVEPEESTGYNGLLTTKFAMLGASSIADYKDVNDMVIYYKFGLGDWTDYITYETVSFPESVNITHINGVCVDPSCDGTVIEVTLKFNDATPYNNETASVSTFNPYKSTFAEPVIPSKLGYDFICWELDGECYDFDTILKENITLEATWSPRTYNVTYHDTVGGGEKTITCDFASATPCAYIPYDSDLLFELPAGYTFVGWSIAKTGEKVYNNNDIIELYGENTNIDLYSIFSSGTYSVSYNLAGGTFAAAVSPVTEYDPSNLTYNLYTPTRVGYTFKGWTVDSASSTGSAKINANNTFTITSLGSVTLKATWEAIKYNVVYNNGSNIKLNTNPCVYDSNCSLDLSKITVPAGKELKDLKVSVNGNTYAIGSTVKNLTTTAQDLIATATFSDIVYNISYDYAGGTVTNANATEIKLNGSIVLNTPTKVGYTFDGWTVTNSLTLKGGTITLNSASDATVTAKWTANNYNVYYKNGTTDVLLSTSGCTYDQFCSLDFSKFVLGKGEELDHVEGLVNGSNSTIGNKVFNLTSASGGKFYVTPVFSKIPYNITYNLNGGSLLNPNASVITYGTLLTLTAPTREGYTFDGWEVTSGSAIANKTSVSLNDAGDIALRAKWIEKQFTVDFDLNGGNGNISSVSCSYTNCKLPTDVPVMTNYDFDGWMYNGVLYEPGDSVVIDANGAISFVAKWVNTNVYKIKYTLNGGTFEGVPATTFVAGDNFKLTEPARDGYKFAGWFDGDGEKVENVVGKNSDINVEAHWNAISYTVYLHKDSTGDSILNEIHCDYDKACSLGNNAGSFTNERLLGWSKSAGGTVFYGDNLQLMNLVTEDGVDVHLYPILEEIKDDYLVTYYLDGGSFVDEDSVVRKANKGEAITLPEVEKFAYEVDYWVTDTGVEINGDTYTVSDNVVLVPVWKERSSFTINLINNLVDPIEKKSTTCVFGEACKLPANTFVAEYRYFDSWWFENSIGLEQSYFDGAYFTFTFDNALALNSFEVDLIAGWAPNRYNITYTHDSEVSDPSIFLFEDSYYYLDPYVKVPLNMEPNSDGADFVAWSYNGEILPVCSDDSDYACLDVSTPVGDVEFVAHYSDEKVKVNWSYSYEYEGMMGGSRTEEDDGSIELTYGDLIVGLPEEITYGTFGSNSAKISYWTLDGKEIDLKTYRVTDNISIEAVF